MGAPFGTHPGTAGRDLGAQAAHAQKFWSGFFDQIQSSAAEAESKFLEIESLCAEGKQPNPLT